MLQVWYQKRLLPAAAYSRAALQDTHVCLGWLQVQTPEAAFAVLNGCKGEAAFGALPHRALCEAGLIGHQSMSVGDVVVDLSGTALVCGLLGWKVLP